MTQEVGTDYTHINLNEVNPQATPIAPKSYTLQVLSAEVKGFKYGPASKLAGQDGSIAKLTFAIASDEEFAGRKVYDTTKPLFLPGKSSEMQLRRLMDATGVQQTGTFDEWLQAIVGARFDAPVEIVTDFDKRTTPPTERQKPAVDMWSVSPATN